MQHSLEHVKIIPSVPHPCLLTVRMRCYFVKVRREKEPRGAHLFGGSVRG